MTPNILFSSDMHFRHKNIIKYCNRPFESIEEMEEALITNHNALVKPNDIWYHLGDFCFAGSDAIASILKRLNGHKIFLKGNHDHKKNFTGLIDEFHNDWFGKLGKNTYHLYHYPIQSWNGAFHGSIHLHGHSHGTTPSPNMLRMDVGVDCTNMRPIELSEVEKIMGIKRAAIEEARLTKDPGRAGHHSEVKVRSGEM